MSSDSLIQETIDPTLLDTTNRWSVVFVDNAGRSFTNETPIELNNPFSIFDPNHFLPDNGLMDIQRFFVVASQLINYAQESEGTVEKERVRLVEWYPVDHLYTYGDEVITYRILRRIPANMDTKAQGRPQRKARFSYDLQTPAHPNKVIVVNTRPIDHKIEFSCWARTPSLADRRALWLERLFITHSWAFKVQGVDRFFWEGRGADTTWKHGEHSLYQRPLEFMVRLFDIEVEAHSVLREMGITISID